MAGCFVGWAVNVLLRQTLPLKTAHLLPLVAVYIPVLQFFLFGYSIKFGGQWGPAITEGLTLLPLAVLSASCVADNLEQAKMTALPAFIAEALPGIGSWGLFKFFEGQAEQYLQARIGTAFLYTRMGLEILLAGAYAVFAPSKWLALALPALLHTAMWNTHVPTSMALAATNETMLTHQWTILERRESVTGYISVMENLKEGFRVLRCDHSLLGGEWINHRGKASTEPIYGVFAMLEAVRLVNVKEPVPDKDANALVIGLGIGTTPTALVTHGIKTKVVEIDPVVHEFAVKYFEHKENTVPALQDAVGYTRELAQSAPGSYDYIVHDVFTGGAEPVVLFTVEFLQGLSTLLKPDGVIAIVRLYLRCALPLPLLTFAFRTTPVTSTCRLRNSSRAPSSRSSPRAACTARPRRTPSSLRSRAMILATSSSSAARPLSRSPSATPWWETTSRATPGRRTSSPSTRFPSRICCRWRRRACCATTRPRLSLSGTRRAPWDTGTL
jgi:hypothetical protein